MSNILEWLFETAHSMKSFIIFAFKHENEKQNLVYLLWIRKPFLWTYLLVTGSDIHGDSCVITVVYSDSHSKACLASSGSRFE